MDGVSAFPRAERRDQPRNLDTPRRASSSSSSSSSSTGNTRAIPMHAPGVAARGASTLLRSRANVRLERVFRSPTHLVPARRRRAYYIPARAGWNDFAWSRATIASNERAASTEGGELRSIALDVGADAAAAYAVPGQFIQIRTSEEGKPAFIAVASAPGKSAAGAGTLELLVKAQPGTTASDICALAVGAEVEASPVMGKGFDLSAVSDRSRAILFATGSGISPVRALLVSGALAGKERVTLYYGTRDVEATAFAEESATWPCEIVRVYSDESGAHVQDALREDIASGKIDVDATFAVLCGQKEMAEDVIALLGDAGVPKDAMVMNF